MLSVNETGLRVASLPPLHNDDMTWKRFLYYWSFWCETTIHTQWAHILFFFQVSFNNGLMSFVKQKHITVESAWWLWIVWCLFGPRSSAVIIMSWDGQRTSRARPNGFISYRSLDKHCNVVVFRRSFWIIYLLLKDDIHNCLYQRFCSQ